MITVYKVVRSDLTDLYTGKLKHEPGAEVRLENPAAKGSPLCCAGVLHVSPTLNNAIWCARDLDRGRPWRYLRIHAEDTHLIGKKDEGRRTEKWGFSGYRVDKEVTIEEMFPKLATNIKASLAEQATWKSIPWLKPSRRVTQEEIQTLLGEWHDAIAPWAKKCGIDLARLPRVGRIVTTPAADADADAAAAAAAAAATADAAAADAAAAAADDDAAAADAAAAADDGFYRVWPYWARWYVRPRYAFWRQERWRLFMAGPNPWEPIVKMFKLGCVPIGYCTMPGDPIVAFTVYVPHSRPASAGEVAT